VKSNVQDAATAKAASPWNRSILILHWIPICTTPRMRRLDRRMLAYAVQYTSQKPLLATGAPG